MSYLLTPKNEIMVRLTKLQERLKNKGLDGALITQNVDIYYFSGTMQNSTLFVPVSGDAILFVKKSVERAKEETPLFVEPYGSTKQIPKVLFERGYPIEKIGTELDVLPYNQYQRIKKAFTDSEFKDISFDIKLQRSVKSEYELELLRSSAKVVNEAILELPRMIKVGMSELELSSEIEKFVRDRGHLGYIRTRAYNMELVLGMVAAGESAAIATSFDGPAGGQGITPAMPQSAGWKKIEENEPVIVDVASSNHGYIIDQTRLAVVGELAPELEEVYQLSLQILRTTEINAKAGTLWSEHYLNALRIVEEAGYRDHFMGYKNDQAKFLGHGVGLELDEFPVLAEGLDFPLEEGMVIAVEPKFTFPGKGVIGVENTYVVTKEGLKHLSHPPEEIVKIPKFK